ncbi:hypothetical protein [Bosea sp. (in: a-proteobacteria)]|uniref:hypothetical protein n=1 Tax=Bosea sp. (in: a-proteobacteria) TaxID=1871050 RepID=UPI001AC1DB49|nr:hypothetical protein [Bosea sp. (in: a-proteobacteria)]MBN9438246.1 hypothetical protein [Bosea sp. (in: a-proteobacteria)]
MIYEPDGAVLGGFLSSNARVRIIRGPIRSGTSSMCCQEIWRRACEQAPGPDGVRRTRWFVSRNTYPDLQQSTIKTWLAWYPEREFGRFIWSKPMVHAMRKPAIHCEVVFIALDKPDEVSKLRSTEWTGGWFNELEYVPKEIFDEAESRAGYYPAVKDGGATWSGIMGDMNAPTEDNWLAMMAGEVPLPDDMPEDERQQYRWPEGWDYFVQPPGLIEVFGADGKTVESYKLNPKAENLRWIPKINGKPLYLETIKGKTKRWIDSRIMNRITAPIDGSPVWPMFVEETHVAKTPLRYHEGYPLQVGLDFGRRPAAIFGQLISDRWQIIGELYGTDEGASTFAPRVRRWIVENCPGLLTDDVEAEIERAVRAGRIRLHGDPKGNDGVQTDDRTAYDVFQTFGLRVTAAPVKGNNVATRIEAVETVLNGMRDGMPRFLLSPNCRKLKMAMAGGYHFKKGDFQKVEPHKDPQGYSDVSDALQYLLIGGGEASVMTGRSRPDHQQQSSVRWHNGRRSLRRVP